MMSNVLEAIGTVGILISAIPTALGFWLVLLAVLTRPNHTGAFHSPLSIIAFMVKSPEEVAYGGSLFFKWGIVLAASISLVDCFGNT